MALNQTNIYLRYVSPAIVPLLHGISFGFAMKHWYATSTNTILKEHFGAIIFVLALNTLALATVSIIWRRYLASSFQSIITKMDTIHYGLEGVLHVLAKAVVHYHRSLDLAVSLSAVLCSYAVFVAFYGRRAPASSLLKGYVTACTIAFGEYLILIGLFSDAAFVVAVPLSVGICSLVYFEYMITEEPLLR